MKGTDRLVSDSATLSGQGRSSNKSKCSQRASCLPSAALTALHASPLIPIMILPTDCTLMVMMTGTEPEAQKS